MKLSSNDRVDTLLSWIDAEAPPLGLATLYFDRTDTEGHHYGPDSPEVNAAAAEVDAAIARLVAGLKARGLFATTNIVVVADHGMAPQPLSGLVEVADPGRSGQGQVRQHRLGRRRARPAGLRGRGRGGDAEAHPHLTCWEKDKIPARYGYGTNPRVPPIVCLADLGWYFATASALKKRLEEHPRDGGAHGYDPYDPTCGRCSSPTVRRSSPASCCRCSTMSTSIRC
jgi:predicted AlkP superfamily pyrophosphatase or phosphodiesterase